MKKFIIIFILISYSLSSLALSVDDDYNEEQISQDRYNDENIDQVESPERSMAIESDEISPEYEQVDETREESSPEAYEEPQETSDY